MGLFYRATITPTKAEVIANWAPTQSWCPPSAATPDVVGSYRFDDPENRAGMEGHLVTTEGTLLHVPLTYRDEPVAGADDALVTEMEHSELGTRWIYDGLSDERYITMLAAAAMTGQGEALGMAMHDGRWHVAPASVRIQGGGWSQERVAIDNFERVSDDISGAVFANDRFELTCFRRPVAGPRPAMALTATWEGQADPVILAEVRAT